MSEMGILRQLSLGSPADSMAFIDFVPSRPECREQARPAYMAAKIRVAVPMLSALLIDW